MLRDRVAREAIDISPTLDKWIGHSTNPSFREGAVLSKRA